MRKRNIYRSPFWLLMLMDVDWSNLTEEQVIEVLRIVKEADNFMFRTAKKILQNEFSCNISKFPV